MNLAKIIPIIYLLLALSAAASGLSITPSRLDFAVDDGKEALQTITVMNPTADVMVFEVYADEFSNVISLRPESFTLESGGRKEVSVMIDASNSPLPPLKIRGGKGGVISTNLSIVGKALAESKVNVAAGAKLPVTIAIDRTAAKPPFAQYGFMMIIALIISLLLIRKLMDSKPKDNKPKKTA